jgi:sec-independent protein translocase protein TatB
MFDIGWGELLVIGIVALIVIGPKELPTVLRTVGQWMGKVRRMASEFQGQFQEAMREAELSELRKEVDEMTSKAHNLGNFDPIGDVRKEIESATGDFPNLDSPTSTTSSTPAPDATAAPAAATDALPPPGEQAAAEAAPTPVTTSPSTAASSAEPAADTAKPDAGRAPA